MGSNSVSTDVSTLAQSVCNSVSGCIDVKLQSQSGNLYSYQMYENNSSYTPDSVLCDSNPTALFCQKYTTMFDGIFILTKYSCSYEVNSSVGSLSSCSEESTNESQCDAYSGDVVILSAGYFQSGSIKVCMTKNGCQAEVQNTICTGDNSYCVYKGSYTGSECSGSESTLPESTEDTNYCDTDSYQNDYDESAKSCSEKGGVLTASCDRDEQKITSYCAVSESDETETDDLDSDTNEAENTQPLSDVNNNLTAISEKVDATNTKLDEVVTAINSVSNDIQTGFDTTNNLQSTQNDLLNSIDDDVAGVRDSIETLNSDLSEQLTVINDSINKNGSDSEQDFKGLTGEQLKTLLDGYKAESDAKADILQSNLDTQSQALDGYYSQVDSVLKDTDNPIDGKVFSNPLENVFVTSGNQCPEFSITLFGQTAIMKDHCQAVELLNKYLVLVLWAWCGIGLFNDAKRIYEQVTTGG